MFKKCLRDLHSSRLGATEFSCRLEYLTSSDVYHAHFSVVSHSNEWHISFANFLQRCIIVIGMMNDRTNELREYLKKLNFSKTKDTRVPWDVYFMRICRLVSERSTCLHRKVGAVIVKENRILATGYNQPPSGFPHCDSIGCVRNALSIPSGKNQEICFGLHAEQNALMQAAKFGISTKGATIYVTTKPCSVCARLIINAGISHVVYQHDYPDPLTDYFFNVCGISTRKMSGGEEVESRGVAELLEE